MRRQTAIRLLKLSTIGRATTPTRAHADDAGYDLYTSDDTWIRAGQFVDIPTAVAVQLPPETWGMITGRSSTLRRRGLLVNQGIIDNGYRGELFAGVWNLTKEDVLVNAGERLAQLIILPNYTESTYMVEVDSLDDHERGQKGFGSSGV